MKLSSMIHVTIVHFAMNIATNAEQQGRLCHGLVVDLRGMILRT